MIVSCVRSCVPQSPTSLPIVRLFRIPEHGHLKGTRSTGCVLASRGSLIATPPPEEGTMARVEPALPRASPFLLLCGSLQEGAWGLTGSLDGEGRGVGPLLQCQPSLRAPRACSSSAAALPGSPPPPPVPPLTCRPSAAAACPLSSGGEEGGSSCCLLCIPSCLLVP